MGQNPSRPSSVGGIEFDVLMEQEYVLESEAPQFPVEEGFNISDSILLKPLTLTLVIQISDSPVTWATRFGGPRPGRVNEILAQLEMLWQQKQPVTVVTNLKIYENMAIEKISIPKNPESGSALKIPMEFKQIRVVSVKTTTIPMEYLRGGDTKTAAGTAQTKEASGATGEKTRKSILSSLKDTVAGSIGSIFGGA